MAQGPAAFRKQADDDEAKVHRLISEAMTVAPGDPAFITAQVTERFIAGQIGHDSHPRALELRRRIGL